MSTHDHLHEITAPSPRSRAWAWVEFAIVAAIFWVDIHSWHHLIFFSKTLYLLVLAWISLRLRGLGWRNVGLRKPLSWPRAVIIGVLAGCAMEALELFVTQPLLERWLQKPPDLSELQSLFGNWHLLLGALALTWTLAAFGEEMVHRGYLLNRIQDVLGNSRVAQVSALLIMSVVFGLAHYYQGATGILENGLDGLLLGILYVACGRNLWVPILAHGVTDSVDVTLMYFGKYPGMH